jgi:asparagine synthase (glutamine-hydrolysing)
MCGIFAYLGKVDDDKKLEYFVDTISHRGPDDTIYKRLNETVFFGFHRLSICDTSSKGSQPMCHPNDNNITLICNGEIYNHKELEAQFNIKTSSGSDCEIILHLYKIFGITNTFRSLNGDFAFILHDATNNITYAARDRFGVRPLFYGVDANDSFIFSSELKAITKLTNHAFPFVPGKLWSSNDSGKANIVLTTSYKYNPDIVTLNDTITSNIYKYLDKAVKRRMIGEREIGCLLSGGLDSSVVTALVSKYADKQVQTFSIGLKGSTDLKYAAKVAKHLNTLHHEVIFTEKEGLEAVANVIYALESYDITTVRASVGMYLVSKYIREHTNVKVIFSGEGSDEVAQGYIYFHNAPSSEEAHAESNRLIKDLYLYDVLRSDRTTSAHGLEVRVPFLDIDFVEYYMQLPGKLKQPNKEMRCEKYVLRKAFEHDNLLPHDVIWRPKEAFSDGVSGLEMSWYEILQKHANSLISNEELDNASTTFPYNTPTTKEAYWYRIEFEKHYENKSKLIPYYWMPKWSNTTDPSARSLKHYVQ